MKWEDERYVRLYTRDTVTWLSWCWEARTVFTELLRKVDRSGVLDLGDHGVTGLAVILRLPVEVVEKGLPDLLRKDKRGDATVEMTEERIGIPKFVEAQEARASDAKRAREYRERMRTQSSQFVTDESRNVTDQSQNVSQPSHGITDRHAPSHAVTPSLAVPSLAVPNQAESGSHPVAAAKGGRKKHRHPETQVPSSDAYVDEVDAWAEQWGIDPNHPAFVTFLNHHRLKGTWGRDWLAGWRTWMSREKPAPGPRVNETPGANRRGDGGAPLRLFGGNR